MGVLDREYPQPVAHIFSLLREFHLVKTAARNMPSQQSTPIFPGRVGFRDPGKKQTVKLGRGEALKEVGNLGPRLGHQQRVGVIVNNVPKQIEGGPIPPKA